MQGWIRGVGLFVSLGIAGSVIGCGALAESGAEQGDASTRPAPDAAGLRDADRHGDDDRDSGLGDADASSNPVDAAHEAGAPTIDTVSPMTQFEGETFTIMGTNFSSSAQVRMRDMTAKVRSATSSELVVEVPDFPEIIAGPPIASSIVVTVPGSGEVTFSGIFRVRGN